MALTTANNRASSFLVALPFGRVFPDPDGSLGTLADKQHSCLAYRGVLAHVQIITDVPPLYRPRRVDPATDTLRRRVDPATDTLRRRVDEFTN